MLPQCCLQGSSNMSCMRMRCQLGLHAFLPLPILQFLILLISSPLRFQVCSICQALSMTSLDMKSLGDDNPTVPEDRQPINSHASSSQRLSLYLLSQAHRIKTHFHLNTQDLLMMLLEVLTKLQGHISGYIRCHCVFSLEADELPSPHHNGTGSGQSRLLENKQTSRSVLLPSTPAGPGPHCVIY